MALQPSKYNGQDRLSPGARGESFQTDIPGYRDQAGDARLNRTNNKLNTNSHDVPNIKYEFDRRLPVLFRYGFGFGYNQIVIPKGRVVAADPYMDLYDFETKHKFSTLTLANGGVPVRLRTAADKYRKDTGAVDDLVTAGKQDSAVYNADKDWMPLVGMTAAYTKTTLKPFATAGPAKQLADAGYKIDSKTGRVVNTDGTAAAITVRPANIPVGVMHRNEYTRDTDAYNGIMPGAVLTDAMLELPWFTYKDKAEQNPWGSSYGLLFPGALVKSDENGRFIVSPLSFEANLATMTVAEYELERQQIIGQVYSVDKSLLPEGAARWATWALEDRLNFNEFNPDTYRQNNRNGEDAINNSPYNSTGEYPGYPYETSFVESDLHMMADAVRGYNARMNQEYKYDNLGIPGLTDGYNAVVQTKGPEVAGYVHYAGGNAYVDYFFRTLEVNVEANSIQIALGDAAYAPCTVGADLVATIGATSDTFIKVKYADPLQGIIVLEVSDKAKADTFLQAAKDANNNLIPLKVSLKYNKRGLAGVPTYLDWDGCIGSVKVLLTK